MGAEGTTHKYQNGRREDDTVRNKARFIKALSKGMQPALAAKHCRLGYSTVYEWRADDPKFAKQWVEAIELGLDSLEFDTYSSGLSTDRQFILKARRKEVFGTLSEDPRITNNINNTIIPPQEHEERLVRLGLTQPLMIEADYEELDVAVSPPTGNNDPSSS